MWGTGILLLAVNVLPVWQISLVAPQYPEPVYLYIYTHGLEGAVSTLNILNHYIGMKMLPEDMLEFRLFPIILILMSVAALFVGYLNKGYRIWWVVLLVGCIVAAWDFYAWEYYYGHHLDPKAPIKIPGQAYTPPMLGTKTILNFKATALPHWGSLFLFGALALAMWADKLNTTK